MRAMRAHFAFAVVRHAERPYGISHLRQLLLQLIHLRQRLVALAHRGGAGIALASKGLLRAHRHTRERRVARHVCAFPARATHAPEAPAAPRARSALR
jgi:hypothetical protein